MDNLKKAEYEIVKLPQKQYNAISAGFQQHHNAKVIALAAKLKQKLDLAKFYILKTSLLDFASAPPKCVTQRMIKLSETNALQRFHLTQPAALNDQTIDPVLQKKVEIEKARLLKLRVKMDEARNLLGLTNRVDKLNLGDYRVVAINTDEERIYKNEIDQQVFVNLSNSEYVLQIVVSKLIRLIIAGEKKVKLEIGIGNGVSPDNIVDLQFLIQDRVQQATNASLINYQVFEKYELIDYQNVQNILDHTRNQKKQFVVMQFDVISRFENKFEKDVNTISIFKPFDVSNQLIFNSNGYVDMVADSKRYYSEQLDIEELQCLQRILQQIQLLQLVIHLEQIEFYKFYRVLQCLELDFPEIFFNVEFRCQTQEMFIQNKPFETVVKIYATYKSSKQEMFKDQNLIERVSLLILAPIIQNKEKMNICLCEKIILDWLRQNIEYSVDQSLSFIRNCLVQRKCNAFGLARTFQLLLNKLGISAVLICGQLQNQDHACVAVMTTYSDFTLVDVTACVQNPNYRAANVKEIREFVPDFQKFAAIKFVEKDKIVELTFPKDKPVAPQEQKFDIQNFKELPEQLDYSTNMYQCELRNLKNVLVSQNPIIDIKKNVYRYLVEQLDKAEGVVLQDVLQSLQQLAPYVRFRVALPRPSVLKIMQLIECEVPQIWFALSYKLIVSETSGDIEGMQFNVLPTKESVRQKQTEINEVVKQQFIHRLKLLNRNSTEAEADALDIIKAAAQKTVNPLWMVSAYGCLCGGSSFQIALSKAFCLMIQETGIPCMSVINSDYNAHNLIYLGNSWRIVHVDQTANKYQINQVDNFELKNDLTYYLSKNFRIPECFDIRRNAGFLLGTFIRVQDELQCSAIVRQRLTVILANRLKDEHLIEIFWFEQECPFIRHLGRQSLVQLDEMRPRFAIGSEFIITWDTQSLFISVK